jgi:hypothetical protein
VTSKIVARVFLTLGFLAASVSYSSWTAQRTILDPAATRGASHALLSTPALQAMFAKQIRTALLPVLGTTVNVPKLNAAIDRAVADPRFVGAFEDAIVSLQKGVLSDGSNRGPVTLDASAVTTAIHDALARTAPKMANKAAKVQSVKIPIGGKDIPHVGDAIHKVRTVGRTALAVAILLVGGALLLVHDRKMFRRVGRRTAFLAIAPVLVFVVLPHVLLSMHKSPLAVSGAMLQSYGHRVVFSAAVLAIVGGSTWLIALAMPSRTRVDDADPVPQRAPAGLNPPDLRTRSLEPVPTVPEGLYL